MGVTTTRNGDGGEACSLKKTVALGDGSSKVEELCVPFPSSHRCLGGHGDPLSAWKSNGNTFAQRSKERRALKNASVCVEGCQQHDRFQYVVNSFAFSGWVLHTVEGRF